ncbi:MAG: hypothetical protein AB7I27_10715 [Bacteriovoracaceae bacterium]
MRKLLTSLIFLISLNSKAYEVDNFTSRDKLNDLPDSLEVLNAKVNSELDKAIKEANLEGECTKDANGAPSVSRYFERRVAGGVVSKIESWASEEKSISRIEPAENMIYSGKSAASGIILSLVGIEPSIKLNGVFIGVDKLGHFFDQGHAYFGRMDTDNFFEYGENLEKGWFGLLTTGVKSYGDLGANFSGFKFWTQFFEGSSPYVKCEKNKYVRVRNFNWADYVNDSWDEGINCSEFSEAMTKAVGSNLARLGLKCPVEEEKCKKMVQMDCAQKFISPKCIEIAADNLNQTCSWDATIEKACESSKEPLPESYLKDVEKIKTELDEIRELRK